MTSFFKFAILSRRLIIRLPGHSFVNRPPGSKLNGFFSANYGYVLTQHRTIFKAIFLDPPTGHNLPGQGLKKITPKEDQEFENNSIVLRFINRRIEDQKAGKEKFPILPDYKFIINIFIAVFAVLLVGWAVHVDIKTILFDVQEQPVYDKSVLPDRPNSIFVYLYKVLPLRFFSRLWGRVMELKLKKKARKPLLTWFCYFTGANVDEALVKDLTRYKSIASFFRRKLDSALRPIDKEALLVSPVDGKVLISGIVSNNEVEQVKGSTYTLKKFLGPVEVPEPQIDVNQTGKGIKITKVTSLHPNHLMHDPKNNVLYQCVIYLGPGDYHGFHSPCDWVVKRRRHFPGDLLSVNSKVVSKIKELFVLNERVVLSGTWKHGYFSMAAIGATNVGSIKIYEDQLLHTNYVKWKPGTFYDYEFGKDGLSIEKGKPVGEFNFGSTVVLIFEAPKNFTFCLQDGQVLKYGEKI